MKIFSSDPDFSEISFKMSCSRPSRPDLEISKVIGEGTFATVFKGTYCGNDVAIKVVGYHVNQQANVSVSSGVVGDFQEECKKMESCRHDNVVLYMKTVDGGVTLNGLTYPALVMTLMETDLKSFLKFQAAPLPSYKEVKIAHDIAKALHYLHDDVKIIHGDLHSGNVLVDQLAEKEGPSVRLCDFGFTKSVSNVLDKHRGLTLSPKEHSAKVESQEAIQKRELRVFSHSLPDDFTPERDIFEFGIVMWDIHLLPGCKDGENTRPYGNLEKIKHRQLHDIIKQCWQKKTPEACSVVEQLKGLRESITIPVNRPKDKFSNIEDVKKQIKELEKILQLMSANEN